MIFILGIADVVYLPTFISDKIRNNNYCFSIFCHMKFKITIFEKKICLHELVLYFNYFHLFYSIFLINKLSLPLCDENSE